MFLVAGVGVEDFLTPSLGITDATNSQGEFQVQIFVDTPPVMGWTYDVIISADVPFKHFNAKGEKPPAFYPAIGRSLNYVHNLRLYGQMLESFGQVEQGIAIQNMSITQRRPEYAPIRILMTLQKLDGFAVFPTGIAIGDSTQYQFNPPILNPVIYNNVDIDGDGNVDQLTPVANDPNNIDVNFSGVTDGTGSNIDVTRVADTQADFRHQGLLSQISAEDIKNTDIFAFRLSTGQLINITNGLTDDQYHFDPNLNTAVTSYSEYVFSGSDSTKLSFSLGNDRPMSKPWEESTAQDPAAFKANEPTYVRVGEQVKVIAINRATGYIGSTIATLDGRGGINTYAQPISLNPPNIKVHVKRHSTVTHGATAGEDRENTVTFEGTGLTSDEMIVLTTEWYDHDGTPLIPGGSFAANTDDSLRTVEELAYTGRLSVIAPSGGELTPASSGTALINITPGTRTQLVRLPGADLRRQHYYFHLNGQHINGNPAPSFATDITRPAPFNTRPMKYVPFKVSMLDEQASIDQQFAFNQDLTTNNDPVYRWVYRPEMQFSLYDLEVRQIMLTNETSQDVVNLLNEERPGIYNGDVVDVFLTMLEPELQALESFAPEQEFIFDIAGHEIAFTPGTGEPLINLLSTDYLSQIDFDDYLLMSIYQNSDSANKLWEFGFVINGLHVYHPIPGIVDEKEAELKLLTPQSTDHLVHTLGGIRLKYEYHPPVDTAIETLTWKFMHNGYYCLEPGVDNKSTSDACEYRAANTDYVQTATNNLGDICNIFNCGIWWEPVADDTQQALWQAGLTIDNNSYIATTRSTALNNPNPAATHERSASFNVVSRMIGPGMADPKGEDIRMLEAMLWQFGYGPNYAYEGDVDLKSNDRGYLATRIEKAKRDKFTEGCPARPNGLTNCTDTDKSFKKATMEMMVWRFKYANEINDTDPVHEDSTVGNRNVNNEMLLSLQSHWNDYFRAYNFAPNEPNLGYLNGDYQQWLNDASTVWNGIYDNIVHQSIMADLGYTPNAAEDTRWEVTDAIIANESGREQWGNKAISPYRIVQGAADSHASPGFSQIKSRYVWGVINGRKKLVNGSFIDGTCTALNGINIYKPDDAVRAVPVWTVGNSCGTSFTRAFGALEEYDSSYDNTGQYPKLVKARNLDVLDDGKFDEKLEGNYERLAKALAAYNQGALPTFWSQYTWPELLKLRNKECGINGNDQLKAQCNGLKYVISKLKKEKRLAPNGTENAFKMASYTWKDQDVDTTVLPNVTFTFCFDYGETEWDTGKSWKSVRDAAADAAVLDITKREGSCL